MITMSKPMDTQDWERFWAWITRKFRSYDLSGLSGTLPEVELEPRDTALSAVLKGWKKREGFDDNQY